MRAGGWAGGPGLCPVPELPLARWLCAGSAQSISSSQRWPPTWPCLALICGAGGGRGRQNGNDSPGGYRAEEKQLQENKSQLGQMAWEIEGHGLGGTMTSGCNYMGACS